MKDLKNDASELLGKLKGSIDNFLEHYLPEDPSFSKARKVVHDGLWGTLSLHPWEVSFLDTPLLQRLRQIHQTGFTLYTYPSSTHTRFEHTLGVMHNVQRLSDAILQYDKDEKRLSSKDVFTVRLAALLHDIGHGPYSHTSEEIYSNFKVVDDLKRELGVGSPHEMMAHMLVTSSRFQNFAQRVADHSQIEINTDDIANFIIGKDGKNPRPYLREIINGPFDADKLDYLYRDSHFSGLPLSVDIDRLFYTVRIAKVDGVSRLVVTQSGATPLEQILISKMGLFSSVYQHHKVRVCDCMLAGVFEYIRDNNIELPVCGRLLRFDSPVDFLWITDGELLSAGYEARKNDPILHKLIHNIYFRRFLKRAMIISRATVETTEDDSYDELQRHTKTGARSYNTKRQIAREIWDRAGRPCERYEVWLDLPQQPDSTTATKTYVLPSPMPGVDPLPLEHLFPSSQWSKQYVLHKWRGHVFCPPHCIDDIAKAAKHFFEEQYGIRMRDNAFTWCKVPPPA